jgi:MFS family permease
VAFDRLVAWNLRHSLRTTFRNMRRFPLFLGSVFASRLADQALLVLVPLAVLQETGSGAWSALAFAMEAAPRFLAFPICGALCDRHSPARLLQVSQLLRGAFCLVTFASPSTKGQALWLVVCAAVCGVFSTQAVMAREVLLVRATSASRMQSVIAKAQVADQVGHVCGPLLAGALLGVGHWSWVAAAAAVLFLTSDVLTRLSVPLHVAPAHVRSGATLLSSLKVGFSNVLSLRGLSQLTVLSMAENLILGIALGSVAVLSTERYQWGAEQYALLQAAGAGAAIGVLTLVAWFGVSVRSLGTWGFTLVLAGACLLSAGQANLYAAGFVMIVGFDKMFSMYQRLRRQDLIPVHDFGKTTGVVVLLNNSTQPLAGVVLGAAATHDAMLLAIAAAAIIFCAIGVHHFAHRS